MSARGIGRPNLVLRRVPADFPVRPLRRSTRIFGRCTCGTCGLSWNDNLVTSYTPAPSARCPFEAFHDDATDQPAEGGGK